jgi:hypothetical protein
MAVTESPQVAVDGGGAVHVLWTAHSGFGSTRDWPAEVWQRVRRNGRWSAPILLYLERRSTGLGGRSLAAGVDAHGDVHVLFVPAGRGFGHVVLRGERIVSPAAYLDHDGGMMAFAAPAAGAPPEFAYVGEMVSRQRPVARSDVFVRALEPRGAPRVEAYYGPDRYSHYPQLVVDRRGVRHLLWLEDTDGTVQPEALFHATLADGKTWSRPRDLTPAALRGGVLFRVAAVADGGGRIHLALRRAEADGSRPGLYYFSIDGDAASPAQTLSAPGALGAGDTQLVYDPVHARVVALWRGSDGVYRWRTLTAGGERP